MSFKFESSGSDEFLKKLSDISKGSRDLDNANKIPFDELFPDSFMKKHTSFKNINNFLKESDFDWENKEDIPKSDLDKFVKDKTDFQNWSNMFVAASEAWTAKQLNL